MRLFPRPGTLATAAGRSAVLCPPFAHPATPFVFDAQLQTFLSAALGFTVYPLYSPQSIALPTLTYTMTGKARTHVLKGSAGVAECSYQFTAWSNDYLESAAMAEALFAVLDSYAGPMGTATVQSALADGDEVALYNAPVNASASGVHQRVCPYAITHLHPPSNPTAARG